MRSVSLAVLVVIALAACGAGHDTTTQANTKAEAPIVVNQATRTVPTRPSSPEPDAGAPLCRNGDARVVGLDVIGHMTGEGGFAIVVADAVGHPCNIEGFPMVAVEAGVRRVPFATHLGGGPYLDPNPPRYVTLRPGKHPSALFEVAKYRCDMGDRAESTDVLVRLPGDTTIYRLSLKNHLVGADMNWCKPVRSAADRSDYQAGMRLYIGSADYNVNDFGPFFDPQPSQANIATLHLQRPIRVSALAGGPAAGVCPSRWPRVIVIVMNPDTPAPRCVSASAGNIIEVVNRTDGFGQRGHSMTISWASFPPVTLRPGQSAIFDAPVGSYLAPGDHILQTRAYPGGPLVPPEGAEIYVRDATHTAGSP